MLYEIRTVNADDILVGSNNRPFRVAFNVYRAYVNKDFVVFDTGETLIRGQWAKDDLYRYHDDGRLQVFTPIDGEAS